ncbi:hypothetical protein H9W90_15365 [Polaribacter pectinis]|uniref:Transporter n=1 Tax=Polaribacter pectinis TaxID=2738844 RepID=A0A7G9LA96_9FLAO|nr:hypothetical protein [Polaribacter pectinis]QNM85545.1 hypothetical protein H9W90_15365 [Polaribacter pectinis]
MKLHSKLIFTAFFLLGINSFAQEDEDTKSNIQTYTPSKLLDKGQWDIKFFNNLYTETSFRSNGVKGDKPRENYFTSTIEAFTGISNNNRINIGAIIEYRSNTIGDRSVFSVFSLNDSETARRGITSFAPAIKIQPFENIGNFSIQSAIHIPLVKNETKDGVFLDQASYTFQNRFFYDYTLPSGNWQLFTELNTEYNFGKKEVNTFDAQNRKTTLEGSFATNTFVVAPGLFMSYFPTDKSTILGFLQHSQRFGDFTQNFTTLGFGGKYQLNQTLNLEVLYGKFIRGNDTGLGQSFNIGLRALF